MDGFFLSVFLAVCMVAAVVIRFICNKYCLYKCGKKMDRTGPDGAIILPVTTARPTIIPANRDRSRRHINMANTTVLQIPDEHLVSDDIHSPVSDNTVFTIYTFPQQGSPELLRPLSTAERIQRANARIPDPPKYSSLPEDLPPKYEELFPSSFEMETYSIKEFRSRGNSEDKSRQNSISDYPNR